MWRFPVRHSSTVVLVFHVAPVPLACPLQLVVTNVSLVRINVVGTQAVSQGSEKAPDGPQLRRTNSFSEWEARHKVWTAAEVIKAAGYPLEEHTVTTVDGYILRMERIPRIGTVHTDSSVVLHAVHSSHQTRSLCAKFALSASVLVLLLAIAQTVRMQLP